MKRILVTPSEGYAQALGIASGALSLILAGRRSPSTKLAERIFGVLELSESERTKFLASLLEEKKALGMKRTSRKLRREVASARENHSAVLTYAELDRDQFRVIADWYHYALWEMIAREDFQARPSWIAKRLGITATEAKLAFGRLRTGGLIALVDGKWKKTSERLQTKDLSKSTEAHRKRQAQIMAKAAEAVHTVEYDRRHFSGITVNIEPARVPEARERIQKFLWSLSAELGGDSPTQVYEIALQVFPLEKIEEVK